ncbi:MAG: response regulator transcription factor [Salinivirgaceae bacterium]|jgi:DNA-binding NarL/FixJ family response regulator|nr:response regulator transcription factor [Salinivirgaceae bacterium]
MKTTILIADDHALIREGIKAVLNKSDQFNVVGEATNGKETIELLKSTPTDIILLDIDMPQKNGVEVGKWIRSMQLNIKIIYITSHADFFSFYQAWKLNPQGFLVKENALEDILNCLNIVVNDQTYYSSETKAYLDKNGEQIKTYETITTKLDDLSLKEKQVLNYIAHNLTTNEIADKVFNSAKTIENHRYNICKKLNISGSNNLMRFAIQHFDIIINLTKKAVEQK